MNAPAIVVAFEELTDRITTIGDLLLYANFVAATVATVVNVWSYVHHDTGPYRFLKLFRAGIAGAYIGIFAYRIGTNIVVGRSQFIGLGVALASWVCVFILPSLLPPPKRAGSVVDAAVERIKREDADA